VFQLVVGVLSASVNHHHFHFGFTAFYLESQLILQGADRFVQTAQRLDYPVGYVHLGPGAWIGRPSMWTVLTTTIAINCESRCRI
jgi:hypothetical protein